MQPVPEAHAEQISAAQAKGKHAAGQEWPLLSRDCIMGLDNADSRIALETVVVGDAAPPCLNAKIQVEHCGAQPNTDNKEMRRAKLRAQPLNQLLPLRMLLR